jgi:hypothetical protein
MNFKKFLPHVVSMAVFAIAALLYFHPVLKGEKMSQSDIRQYIGMAKEVNDFKAETGEEPYWAESAFSGMPTYQLGAHFPNDFVRSLDLGLRFLPRPADYLFLYFLGFYILMLALKVDWKLGILGALAFGFSTYLIIIFGAGHNAKAHTIAYMPMVLAGVLWVFQRKYLLGFSFTALAMALQIKANHPQMTYYLLFAILILGIVELVDAIRKEKIPVFAKQTGILVAAMLIAVGVNATRLMATKQYADYSTRGKSELTINPDGSKKETTNGLSKEYITQYSYDIQETFNLLVPRYMGGGTVETLDAGSETYRVMEEKFGTDQAEDFTQSILTYWGEQPIIEAPAYIGVVIFFFFFLGIFLVRGKLKYWLVATTVFAILMSWGKNFFLTDFFIDYVPLYNKFRAVSSFQVIAELCVPILGILAIKEFFSKDRASLEKEQALKKALYVTAGLVVVGLLYAVGFSTFEGIRDGRYLQMEQQYQIEGLLEAVIQDRKSLLYTDTFRSLILIGLCFAVLWFYLAKKLKATVSVIAFTALLLFDLLQVNLRYVNEEDFVPAKRVDRPYVASDVDKEILKDKTHYRVANFTTDPFQDGSTSYFHKSIGGYHAAKMGRYQELTEFHIDIQSQRITPDVLNMLNVKYFIFPGEQGQQQVQMNPDTNGNAWFVQEVRVLDNANEEIKALDSLKTKSEAILRVRDPEFGGALEAGQVLNYATDSLDIIKLTDYKLNHLTYEAKSATKQFAVFSEIYYKDGWNAYLNGELVEHHQVNYVLRGMEVPAGEHTIEFKFEPQVIQTGGTISLISYAFLLIIPIGWFFLQRKNQSSGKEATNSDGV